MNEHRVIEMVLACLEKMANRCVLDKVLDAASARKAIDFFETFADRCHHAKEEAYLFPALEARGFSRDHGPTGLMRHEHEQGRHHLQAMKVVIDRAAAGDVACLWRFTEQAWAYISLLRHHIVREDQRLFVMADEHLTDADQASLLEGFTDVEMQEDHAGLHEQYLQVANELAHRFGVPRAHVNAVASHGCGSCCHHG
jgi:hemerythrin-like domain-containing protein